VVAGTNICLKLGNRSIVAVTAKPPQGSTTGPKKKTGNAEKEEMQGFLLSPK